MLACYSEHELIFLCENAALLVIIAADKPVQTGTYSESFEPPSDLHTTELFCEHFCGTARADALEHQDSLTADMTLKGTTFLESLVT